MDVEVRTLTHAVHSGMWGGLVHDSIMTLSRVIASLNDDAGNVAVEQSRYVNDAAVDPCFPLACSKSRRYHGISRGKFDRLTNYRL